MNKATAHIATAHYQTKLHNHRGIAWQADEPEEMGGSTRAPRPERWPVHWPLAPALPCVCMPTENNGR